MHQPEDEKNKRARRVINSAGYRCGGHLSTGGGIRADDARDKLEITKAVHAHEGNMHPGMKKTRLGLAYGGVASGGAPPARSDRPSRGKKGGAGKTHVNILIAPQGDKAGTEGPPPPGLAPPGMPPMGPPPGGPPPIPFPPPRPNPPMASPTGNSPMGVGAPLGGMPPMRKAGGHIGHKRGGRTRLQDGGLPEDGMEGMQVGGMPGMGLPPAQGGGARRAMGLGPPGWPGNPDPAASLAQAQMAQPPGAPMPGGALPPARGGGLRRAAGLGPVMPGADPMASMAQAQMGAVPPPGQPMPGMPAAKRGGRIAHRKAGGRAGGGGGSYSPPDMHAGAGSGEGRLDKIGK